MKTRKANSDCLEPAESQFLKGRSMTKQALKGSLDQGKKTRLAKNLMSTYEQRQGNNKSSSKKKIHELEEERTHAKTASSRKTQERVQNEPNKNIRKMLFKTKKIQKSENLPDGFQLYRNFCQIHSNKLKAEHPKWNKAQIAKITNLLWKKNKEEQKESLKLKNQEKMNIILSGKEAFRIAKCKEGFSEAEIKELWARLPTESKNQWEQENHKKGKEKGLARRESLTYGHCEDYQWKNNLTFLKSRME